jgi:hypothetical protein
MKLGEVFGSVAAWRKLSGINMKPKLAYKILKYTKLVSAEADIAEKQRVSLIHEITGTEDGQEAKIEPNTPELTAYAEKFNEVLLMESDLQQLDVDFEEVVDAVDEKDESLTVNDLAMLEPFFVNDGSVECDETVAEVPANV